MNQVSAPTRRAFALTAGLLGALVAALGLISLLAGGNPDAVGWHFTGPANGGLLLLLGVAAMTRRRLATLLAAAAAALSAGLLAVGFGRLFAAGHFQLAKGPYLLFVLALGFLLTPRRRRPGIALVLGVAVVALQAMADQLFAVPLTAAGSSHAMGPLLLLCLLALSLAWLVADPRLRPVSLLLEPGSSGWLMRRLLPLVLLFPLLAAWIRQQQQQSHPLVDWAAALAFVLLSFVVFLTLLWKAATALDRLDVSRDDLQAYAREVSDLYHQAPCGYHSLDGDGRVVKINDTELGWLGYRREEIIGRRFVELLTPAGAAAYEQHFPALRTQVAAADLELALLRKDGSELPAVVSEVAIRDRAGRFVQTRSSVFDATQRIQAEAALRASEERLRHLLDSTGEGIYALDLEGRCTLCNPAALRLLGYTSPLELIGRDLHALTHHTRADGSPYPRDDCKLLRAARGGVGVEYDDEVFWRADGSRFPVEYRSYPVRRDGAIVGLVVTFSDITTRRNLERQVQQAQKMEAVGRLAAGVAHDFNNLLTVINGYSEMMLAGELPAPLLEPVRSVRTAGERAAGLTHQLLAFSRQQMLQPRVLDLNAMVTEIVPWLQRTLSEEIEVSVTTAANLHPVKADRGQMDQVVMNLVLNARDALDEAPRNRATRQIHISTANLAVDYAHPVPGLAPGEYVRLEVRDNGMGMGPEVQAHIFEPFFTTKPVGKGTGLGLPTVFGIVQQSGGIILVDSAPGRGTAMQLFLPALLDGATRQPIEPLPEPGAAITTLKLTPGRGEAILVVEDESSLRRMLLRLLQARGYTTIEAGRPEEAVRLSRQHPAPIHLLITDVVMPTMTGPALASTLLEERPELKVLYISGYADHALPPGSFLKKPFAPEALARKVREILDENGEPAAARRALARSAART